MAHIELHEEVHPTDAVLVEGFPGMGLVGKIAVDYLVETLETVHFADVHCDALPKAAAFRGGDAGLHTPVRLHADTERDLVVLQSDVQVSPDAAYELAGCLAGWIDETDTLPLYVAGIAAEEEQTDSEMATPPATERETRLRGMAVGDAAARLDETDLPNPEVPGLVSGPTGALLAHAMETDTPAVGVVADTHPKFPDPGAAKAVLERAVEPLANVDVAVDDLAQQAERVRRAKQQLAAQLSQADDEKSSKATPLRMYQ
jgi:uncharacterized protein